MKDLMEKRRHTIVTLWLWAGIIISVLFIPQSIIVCFDILEEIASIDISDNPCEYIPLHTIWGTYNEIEVLILIMQAIAAIMGGWMISCYWMLLRWKKFGFWGLIIPPVVLAVTSVVIIFALMEDDTRRMVYESYPFDLFARLPIISLIPWLILPCVLQIRREHVSCWSLLE